MASSFSGVHLMAITPMVGLRGLPGGFPSPHIAINMGMGTYTGPMFVTSLDPLQARCKLPLFRIIPLELRSASNV